MKVDTLPNGRQLTYGAYKDCSRPLRRCLKQLGSGSVEGGFNAIRTDPKALEEVAAVVDIEKQVRSPLPCYDSLSSCYGVLLSKQSGCVHHPCTTSLPSACQCCLTHYASGIFPAVDAYSCCVRHAA